MGIQRIDRRTDRLHHGLGVSHAGSWRHRPGWCGTNWRRARLRQRWKVSMMIMCPPQHGQGDRGSVSSTGSSGSAGGGTASSCRTGRIGLAGKPGECIWQAIPRGVAGALR